MARKSITLDMMTVLVTRSQSLRQNTQQAVHALLTESVAGIEEISKIPLVTPSNSPIDFDVNGWSYRPSQVDHKVKELVRVVQGLGFETSGSCEGHMEREMSFPWVNLVCSESETNRIRSMLDAFNHNSLIRWKVENIGLTQVSPLRCIEPDINSKNTTDLTELQRSSTELAIFLYNNYYTLRRH